jgi:glycogen debranching enzyme
MTVAPQGVVFSVQEVPFSYYGSWFDISPVVAEKTYADDLHLVSHQTGLHPILRFVPLARDADETSGNDGAGGARADATVVATPCQLAWTHDAGRIELAYERADTVRLRGQGLGLRITAASPTLTPFAGTYFYRDPVDGAHVFTVYGTGRRYRITVLSGQVAESMGLQALGTSERGLVMRADGKPWEIAIEELDSARQPYSSAATFEQIITSAEVDFKVFLEAVAPWRSADTSAAELAAYVVWSATVRPAGFVTRPAVLMSKHWMDKVWSWDHCFNALALARGVPDLAWDQFRLIFDHQDDAGGLPDSVTHSEILYNFVKPPIHGWALHQLRERLPDLGRTELVEVYRQLEKWTNFWLTARRVPGHPLPHYHHGNDSGWDNATTFDPERVIETADLAAFLVLQMRELADLAGELGFDHAAAQWSRTAEQTCSAMLEQLWTGDGFVARGAESRRTWTSSSLLDLMAIVLGPELPDGVRARLARRIEAHLTPHGLATELPSSEHYQADGYWRGPVWAPSTVLIEDGLRRGGYTDLADEIGSRFRALCERSGFAENFDAQTGAGLRDRAYTWTASSYLILAAAYERRRAAAASLVPRG